MEGKAVKEENRKIRFLRFLVDFSVLALQQEDLTFEEASARVQEVKRVASELFPGKEEAFELIYRPRFNRVLRERFGAEFEEKAGDDIR